MMEWYRSHVDSLAKLLLEYDKAMMEGGRANASAAAAAAPVCCVASVAMTLGMLGDEQQLGARDVALTWQPYLPVLAPELEHSSASV
jgi:hypothetical protein